VAFCFYNIKIKKWRKTKMLKKILIAVFALIVLGGSSVAFAWWDKLAVNRLENSIVTIGQGLELQVETVVINPTTAGNLVPASAILKTGDTHSIELSYTVRLDLAVEAPLTLAVNVSNIEVGGVANPFNLIDVAVVNPGSIQNSDVTVTLTVTIDDSALQPADYEAAYLALANQSISFAVSFAASE
jgi:hypothetical protein